MIHLYGADSICIGTDHWPTKLLFAGDEFPLKIERNKPFVAKGDMVKRKSMEKDSKRTCAYSPNSECMNFPNMIPSFCNSSGDFQSGIIQGLRIEERGKWKWWWVRAAKGAVWITDYVTHISPKLFKKGYFRSRNRRKISQTQMTRGKGVDFVKFGGNLSIEISIRWSICNPIQHPLMSCLHDYLVQNFALQPSWFNSWPAIQENIRHHLSLYEYAWCLSFQTWNPLVRAL